MLRDFTIDSVPMSETVISTSSYANRTVLVTGAYGFIGQHTCAKLIDAGAEVHAVTRLTRTPIKGLRQTHVVDLGHESDVARLIETVQPDIVFHLASHVNGSRSIEEVGPTFENNLATTVHLLRHVTGTKCQRIVLAGSLEESSADVPSSPYAASKTAATMYARLFHALYRTPITIARLFMVYGPGQQDARKLVPYVSLSLLSGRRPSLSGGVRPVDWVYIDDVVEALLRCAIEPTLSGKTIDVGTGELTTVRRVAERIKELVGGMNGPVFGAVEDRAAEQVRAADPTAAARLLGRPLVELDAGLRLTVDWFRNSLEDGSITSPDIG